MPQVPVLAVWRIRIILILIQDLKKIRYGPGPNFDTDPGKNDTDPYPGKNDTDPYPGYQENLKNSIKTIIFYFWCVYCLTTIFLYDMITGMVII